MLVPIVDEKEIKSEKQKMLSNEYYVHQDVQLSQQRSAAAELTMIFNNTRESESKYRDEILKELLGKVGEGCEIKQPFRCDYGSNIYLGDRVFMNYGCVILDCNIVQIGNDSLLAPGVQISAAYHPTDPLLRREKKEAAEAVIIGENVWIGSGAVICPGVTIGDNVTIGAGSVVVKNIPSNVVAAGNPCKVIKILY